jgi:hypothetical protein
MLRYRTERKRTSFGLDSNRIGSFVGLCSAVQSAGGGFGSAYFEPVLRIRIHRIHMFLGHPDPDPLVRGMDPDPAPDPDPSIIMQK